MMRRLPMLNQAHACAAGSNRDFAGLRQNRLPDRMSTFEAITKAPVSWRAKRSKRHLLTFFSGTWITGNLNSRKAARRKLASLEA